MMTIDKLLRDLYAARRKRGRRGVPADDLDIGLISRCLDGTATTDEQVAFAMLAARDPAVAEIASAVREHQRGERIPRQSWLQRVTAMPILLKAAACVLLVLGGTTVWMTFSRHDENGAEFRGTKPTNPADLSPSVSTTKRLPYSVSYALLVGNSKYKNGWPALDSPERDVREVGAVLQSLGFVTSIYTNLTKQEFERVFTEFTMKKGADENGRLLFYYAGHGWTMKMRTGQSMGYLVMTDAADPDDDVLKCVQGSVDMGYIVTQAKIMKSRHVLCMFDSCFSGSIFDARGIAVPRDELLRHRIESPGRQFITAGRRGELVRDASVFKSALLDVLSGRVAEPVADGWLTAEEVYQYLKRTVPRYCNQHPQYCTIDDPELDEGDFVFRVDGVKAGQAGMLTGAVMRGTAPTPAATNAAQQTASLRMMWNEGEFTACYDLARQLQQGNPGDPTEPAYWRVMAFQGMHGELHGISRDPSLIRKTEREFEEAARLAPHGKFVDDLYYQWGHFYRGLNMADTAIARFEWVEKNAPDSNWKEGVAYYLALLYFDKGMVKEARREEKKLAQFSDAEFIYDFDRREYMKLPDARSYLQTVMKGK